MSGLVRGSCVETRESEKFKKKMFPICEMDHTVGKSVIILHYFS